MTVSELYQKLSEAFPTDLSCDWDNDGLMCCPDADAEVKRVLLTLDVTDKAVAYAVAGGYDTILSHHPMIFRKLRGITDPKHIRLIQNGIAVLSFHTRLDAAEGGVNHALAARLGLTEVHPFTADGIGLIGCLPKPLPPAYFAEQIKQHLEAPFVEGLCGETPCFRVAVVGGEGKDYVADAFAAGADTYVTGSLSYHTFTDYAGSGKNLLAAGHYFTEQPVLMALADRLSRLTENRIICHVFHSNPAQVL